MCKFHLDFILNKYITSKNSGTGTVAQQVKLPLTTTGIPTGSIQLPDTMSGKAAKDSPRVRAPALMWETLMELGCTDFSLPQPFLPPGSRT